jgi:uncharacterized protein YraI
LVDPSLSINLNVRSGRSTAKNIVAELEPGSIVDGINLQDGWYEVLLPDGGGETGWAYGVYLTEQNE